MNDAPPKLRGDLGPGDLRELLREFSEHHLYGLLSLEGDGDQALTFVDGRIVVAEEAGVNNAVAARVDLTKLLGSLVDGEGFIGSYQIEPLMGDPSAHTRRRYEPLALLGRSSDALRSSFDAPTTRPKASTDTEKAESPPSDDASADEPTAADNANANELPAADENAGLKVASIRDEIAARRALVAERARSAKATTSEDADETGESDVESDAEPDPVPDPASTPGPKTNEESPSVSSDESSAEQHDRADSDDGANRSDGAGQEADPATDGAEGETDDLPAVDQSGDSRRKDDWPIRPRALEWADDLDQPKTTVDDLAVEREQAIERRRSERRRADAAGAHRRRDDSSPPTETSPEEPADPPSRRSALRRLIRVLGSE